MALRYYHSHHHIIFCRHEKDVTECQSEALQIAAVAKGIHKEIFESGFLATFLLVLKTQTIWAYSEEWSKCNSQACLTVAQMIVFNTKKRGSVDQTKNWNTLDREPPFQVYLRLNVHSLAGRKKLIYQLHESHFAFHMTEFCSWKM